MDISKIEAIDPSNCGCLECAIEEYIPVNSGHISEVFKAILDDEIEPRNNLHSLSLVIYENTQGRFDYSESFTLTRNSEYFIIPACHDNTAYTDDAEENHVFYDYNTEENEYEELVKAALEDINLVVNKTDSTLIMFKSAYGEPEVIEVCAKENRIKILWD